LLTLLVIPSFYDSIEIWRDRALAKYQRRAQRWHAAPAFVATLLEAAATVLLLRLIWRLMRRTARWLLTRWSGRRTQPA
jgi:HAE1 family hydrophobic/amphiphilic exporter-1